MFALLIGLSIPLKLEKHLYKVIHLLTYCFVDRNQTRIVFNECSIVQLISGINCKCKAFLSSLLLRVQLWTAQAEKTNRE